ncbi:uncharacterized protein LOC115737680 [Rhodamnia argentea]|uniref:Uncharacterized protein LOC115737680 n=1 Tax=Rhodamnia argentea TaxID=178133 RepID=A0A8B8NUC1_9MYRT|nr:uncharacterized protein LOC115737680 [Rhodamnia argentea]
MNISSAITHKSDCFSQCRGWKALVEEIGHNTKDVADSYVDLRKVGIIDRASGPTSPVKNRSIPQHQAPVKINSSGEVAAGKKFGACKRILREHCQQAETAKRQRIVLALPAFPKQAASHNGPGRRGRIEKTLSRMAKSRSRISSL